MPPDRALRTAAGARRGRVLAGLFAAVITAGPVAAAPPTLSQPFVGQWAWHLASCGPVPAESVVEITPGAIVFYAAGGRVVSVDIEDERSLTVVLDFEGELAERWRETLVLQLSADGTRLALGDREGLLHRCPGEDAPL